jgi:hypothetical protein
MSTAGAGDRSGPGPGVPVDWDLDLPLAGGVGELDVRLPEVVAVEVVASSGLGQVVVLGQEEGGLASRVETSAGGGDRRLRLDVRSGLGRVGPGGSTGCRWSLGCCSCSPGWCSCWTRSGCGSCGAATWCRSA